MDIIHCFSFPPNIKLKQLIILVQTVSILEILIIIILEQYRFILNRKKVYCMNQKVLLYTYKLRGWGVNMER